MALVRLPDGFGSADASNVQAVDLFRSKHVFALLDYPVIVLKSHPNDQPDLTDILMAGYSEVTIRVTHSVVVMYYIYHASFQSYHDYPNVKRESVIL